MKLKGANRIYSLQGAYPRRTKGKERKVKKIGGPKGYKGLQQGTPNQNYKENER